MMGKFFTDEAFREILGYFFKIDPVIMAAEPNDEMVEVLWRAVIASRNASRAFGFVPTPRGWVAGPMYIAGIFVRVGREAIRDPNRRRNVEQMFSVTTLARLRSDMYMAAISGSATCNDK
jgi:hypothetical protein